MRKHAGGQDDAAILLEHLRPDDEVGDAGLVLDGDEHDALGRSRLIFERRPYHQLPQNETTPRGQRVPQYSSLQQNAAQEWRRKSRNIPELIRIQLLNQKYQQHKVFIIVSGGGRS